MLRKPSCSPDTAFIWTCIHLNRLILFLWTSSEHKMDTEAFLKVGAGKVKLLELEKHVDLHSSWQLPPWVSPKQGRVWFHRLLQSTRHLHPSGEPLPLRTFLHPVLSLGLDCSAGLLTELCVVALMSVYYRGGSGSISPKSPIQYNAHVMVVISNTCCKHVGQTSSSIRRFNPC